MSTRNTGVEREWANYYACCLHDTLLWGASRTCTHGGRTADYGPYHLRLSKLPVWVHIEGRNGSRDLAEVEPLAYVSGVGTDGIVSVAPYLAKFSATDGGFPGAYGPRINQRIPDVIRILEHDPQTRQAVLHIHDEDDTARAHFAAGQPADIPCTLSLGFWHDQWSGLCCHAVMRSTDAYIGLYYDVPAFGFIARRVADCFGWEYGRFWFTTTSLHLYEEHRDKALSIPAMPKIVESLKDQPWYLSGGTPVERWKEVQEIARRKLDNYVAAHRS